MIVDTIIAGLENLYDRLRIPRRGLTADERDCLKDCCYPQGVEEDKKVEQINAFLADWPEIPDYYKTSRGNLPDLEYLKYNLTKLFCVHNFLNQGSSNTSVGRMDKWECSCGAVKYEKPLLWGIL